MADLMQTPQFSGTKRGKLLQKREMYSAKIVAIDTAIAGLDKNPALEKLIDAFDEALSNVDGY